MTDYVSGGFGRFLDWNTNEVAATTDGKAALAGWDSTGNATTLSVSTGNATKNVRVNAAGTAFELSAASNWTLLDTQTITGADAATATFTGFANYNYYKIVGKVAGDNTGADNWVRMRFNSDTTAANYRWVAGGYSNGVPLATGANSDANGLAIYILRDGQAATFGMFDARINNSLNTTAKTTLATGGGFSSIAVMSGTWTNTSNLITSIDLRIDGTFKFKVGSTFYLLGSSVPF